MFSHIFTVSGYSIPCKREFCEILHFNRTYKLYPSSATVSGHNFISKTLLLIFMDLVTNLHFCQICPISVLFLGTLRQSLHWDMLTGQSTTSCTYPSTFLHMHMQVNQRDTF